jgi:putative flippase GtrA
VIPAYNPDERFITLLSQLRKYTASKIIVVNDGSLDERAELFISASRDYGCEVLTHKVNKGKGEALKTAAKYILTKYPASSGFVSADSDMQHLPEDILNIARFIDENQDAIILGIRNFNGKDVPAQSKWGNKIPSLVFRINTGVRCDDTQTGLRGIPMGFMYDFVSVKGKRFEFEMNVLLSAARKTTFIQVPIQTVYIEENRSTSFRAVHDSVLIYWNILKFGSSSLLSALVDIGAFMVLEHYTDLSVFLSVVTARIFSGIINFAINKTWVFKSPRKSAEKLLKYLILFLSQMFVSGFLTSLATGGAVHLVIVKICIDLTLSVISYFIQRRLIFT